MPLAPPVIKIVLLVSFIIKYLLPFLLPRFYGRNDIARTIACRHRTSACVCGAVDLFASPLLSILASIVRATEAGMIAFMIRFIRPGIIMERFPCIALSPSDTHCSAFIGFMGMVSVVLLWPLFPLTYPQRGQAVECFPAVEACLLNPA